MSKEYAITSEAEFQEMVNSFYKYFRKRKAAGKDFRKIRIIAKKFVKSKTPAQHKKYFACIGELKKALREAGTIMNEEQIHQMIKTEAGYTKVIHLPSGKSKMVNKSIADNSEDINSREINFLIEFVIGFAQEHLNYTMDQEKYK